jgi:hypothetical protein
LIKGEPANLSVGQMLVFHMAILPFLSEQQVIGARPLAKPAGHFTLNLYHHRSFS